MITAYRKIYLFAKKGGEAMCGFFQKSRTTVSAILVSMLFGLVALGSLGLGLAWEALYRLGLSEVPGIITVSRRKSELLRRAEETRNAVPAFPSAVPSAGDSRAGIAPV